MSAHARTIIAEPSPVGDRPIRQQLATAAGSDQALRDALMYTVLSLGDLTRSGRGEQRPPESQTKRLAEMIEIRMSELTDVQLVAIRTLTESWSRPYELVVTELRRRSATHPVVLTSRQRQVLTLLGDGLKVGAIARRLCLSPRTVEKHLERMYRRLGTSDRLTAVLQARRFGLLEPVRTGD